ncbi:MAG: TonB-dependent siderophore receptor [Rhodovulum sulfidophilum]|uniref:TonB-dependent siderophore receptor n=1 Tax=Rhodovulum sulfidophilum TaxID=35806 RepID=A0A2W5NBH2_RHOSU|nr:MAG: TonB-dependent siderophore receptor [Rhodovulum sulfidophilum]
MTGLAVTYEETTAASQRANPVEGRKSAAEAVSEALAGTGLEWRWTGPGTITIAAPRLIEGAADGVVLDAITVSAAPATTTEDSGSWTTEWMRSATGMPLSQRETPQSTSAITDAQMKDRNITTLTETMDAATGVTVQTSDSERTGYYARGFQIDSFQLDGVPLPNQATVGYGDSDPDMVLYDHVEIVRGATGLMQGAGEPGASVNFIRKRPTDFLRREVSAAMAYPLGARVEADVAGPLNESGTVRGRILGAIDSHEGTLDGYKKDKYVGYGALAFDLGDATVVNLGVSHQATRTQNVTWGGIPPFDSAGNFIDWPISFNLAAPWTHVDIDRTEAFASVEHVFDNGWTGSLTATRVRTTGDLELAWIGGLPEPETGLGMTGSGARQERTGQMTSVAGALNGDFEAFGRPHQFVVGATGSRADNTYQAFGFDPESIAEIGNVYAYDGGFPRPAFTPDVIVDMKGDVSEYGLYGAAQINATDRLALIGGVRVSWWEGRENWDGVVAEYSYDAVLTPYAGFTYDIDDVYTAYGSVTSIYKPQLYQDADGAFLDPRFGYNYELGVKAGFFDGALYASAAVFQTDQRDVAEYVSFDPATGRSVYAMIDGTTTRGFELEAAGALSERWNASFGYTYRYSEDADGEEIYADQPRSSLKAATSYRVPNVLDDRLTVGGAMRWQSGTEQLFELSDTLERTLRQKAYAVFDLNATYDVTEQSMLVLSVNNVLDEKYYRSMGFYNTVVHGDGVAAELMLRARF